MASHRPQIDRRQALAILAAAGALTHASAASAVLPAYGDATVPNLWRAYRDRFVLADGRVIDTFHKGVSHTESQGWGMLLAGAAADWEAFDRIWAWTQEKLLRADLALFAWRWDPATETAPDSNNASDGDILIAWALARAARARARNDLRDAAQRTAQAIRHHLTVESPVGLALLPGRQGFQADGRTTLNLSYYVFPALREFARLDPDPAWARLGQDGVALARRARFGPRSLAPDWLDVAPDGALSPAENWPPRFGFDAVRLPLYLAWAGHADRADLDVYRAAWRKTDPPPAWYDLTGPGQADHAASQGVLAIRALIEGRRPGPALLWPAVGLEDYYAASLALLAALAADEGGLR